MMTPMDRVTRFAWSVLAYNLGVILWGAYVRASGSGAGCGAHWPLCNGEIVPRAPAVATLIEFSHRLTSGSALVAVVALLVWTWRARPSGHPARRAAVAALVLMLSEAAVGAGLVLFQLVADNASIARALFMATHLVNTFLLLGALTLTAWLLDDARRAAGPVPAGPPGRLALALGAVGLLLVGLSGAVAALGDTLYPAGSIGTALAQDLSGTAQLLIRLRLAHPVISLAVSLGVLIVALPVAAPSRRAARPRAEHPARPYARALAVLVFAQLACGALNVLLLAPIWMQLVHLLLADLLWIAFVLTAATSWTARALPAATTQA
jgi:heme A synthase